MTLGLIVSPMVAENLHDFCLDVIPFKHNKLQLFWFIGVGTVVNPLEKSSAAADDHVADNFNQIMFDSWAKVGKVAKAGLDDCVEQCIPRMTDKLTPPSTKNNIIFSQSGGLMVRTRIHCFAELEKTWRKCGNCDVLEWVTKKWR